MLPLAKAWSQQVCISRQTWREDADVLAASLPQAGPEAAPTKPPPCHPTPHPSVFQGEREALSFWLSHLTHLTHSSGLPSISGRFSAPLATANLGLISRHSQGFGLGQHVEVRKEVFWRTVSSVGWATVRSGGYEGLGAEVLVGPGAAAPGRGRIMLPASRLPAAAGWRH